MRKDIALAGKIDAEHRSGQNLCHGAFGNDLFFLRHCAANIRASARRSRLAPPRSGGLSPSPLGDLETAAFLWEQTRLSASRFSGTVPAKALAGIRQAPHVSTMRRPDEVHPPM